MLYHVSCTHVQTPKCTRVATAAAIVDLPSHAQVVDLDPAGSSDPKIIENHHLQWANPPCSIAILTSPEGNMDNTNINDPVTYEICDNWCSQYFRLIPMMVPCLKFCWFCTLVIFCFPIFVIRLISLHMLFDCLRQGSNLGPRKLNSVRLTDYYRFCEEITVHTYVYVCACIHLQSS